MEITRLDTTNRKEVTSFIRFPSQLYRKNKYWVPPFPGEMQLVLDREAHPFYKHSDADFFMARSGKNVVGRIAVLQSRNYCNFHHQKVAFFYYFECQEDHQIAAELLAAAETWAKDHGLDTLLGGKGFLRSNGQGILVEGFESLPAMEIPYNHSYYDGLIQTAGFSKETDYLSGFLDHRIDPRLQTIAEKVRQRGNFWIKGFADKDEMLSWIPQIDEVRQKSFENDPSFYPSTPEELKLISKNIISVAEPEFIKLIMHDEEIAGFIIAYPNINHALQQTHGQLAPLGWLDLLAEKKLTHIIDLNGVGLLSEYQGLGGNALLYSEVEKVILKAGKRLAEIVQVDERNLRSKSDMDTMGVVWNKRHRTYTKNI